MQSGDALIFGGVDVTGNNVTYTANTGKVTFVTKGTYYIEQQYCVSGTPPSQIFPVFKTMANGSDQVGPTIIERYSPGASTDRKIISNLGSEAAVFPTKGSPIKPVRAVAKIVRPSPVAT